MSISKQTKVVTLAVVILSAGAGAVVLAQSQRGVPSDYSVDFQQVGLTAEAASSSDYSVNSSVQVIGVEGGSTNSTDYSVTSGIAAPDAAGSGVSEWPDFE